MIEKRFTKDELESAAKTAAKKCVVELAGRNIFKLNAETESGEAGNFREACAQGLLAGWRCFTAHDAYGVDVGDGPYDKYEAGGTHADGKAGLWIPELGLNVSFGEAGKDAILILSEWVLAHCLVVAFKLDPQFEGVIRKAIKSFAHKLIPDTLYPNAVTWLRDNGWIDRDENPLPATNIISQEVLLSSNNEFGVGIRFKYVTAREIAESLKDNRSLPNNDGDEQQDAYTVEQVTNVMSRAVKLHMFSKQDPMTALDGETSYKYRV